MCLRRKRTSTDGREKLHPLNSEDEAVSPTAPSTFYLPLCKDDEFSHAGEQNGRSCMANLVTIAANGMAYNNVLS